jgi:hypothetical protein
MIFCLRFVVSVHSAVSSCSWLNQTGTSGKCLLTNGMTQLLDVVSVQHGENMRDAESLLAIPHNDTLADKPVHRLQRFHTVCVRSNQTIVVK